MIKMDNKTALQRSENMKRIQSKDSIAELTVRRVIHRMGYRFRLHSNRMPGRPDIVLPRHNKIVFVNGCFWHQHKGCPDGHLPKSNQDYWKPKLNKNVSRDRKNYSELKKQGWRILVVWACEIGNLRKLRKKICRFLED